MPKRDFRQSPERVANYGGREPATAAMLSVIPGLGQFYNGQSIKGFLFMDVAAVNAVLLTIVLFAEPMAAGLRNVLTGNHVKPNDGILQALSSAHLGTPFSVVLLSMILLFVGFAVRDAYDSARGEKLKPIYADSALHLSEAASGSYLFHFAAMISCAVFALFFLIPKPEQRQITEITFESPPQIKDVEPPKPKKFSSEASTAKHHDTPVKNPTPPASSASRPQSQPRQQPRKVEQAETQPAPAKQVAVKQAAAKSEPVPPAAVKPTPQLRSASASATNPTPAPMPVAPKVVAPSPTSNTTPMPTPAKSVTSLAPGPVPMLNMLPKSTAGPAPAPMALNHASSTTTSGPMPAEGKRSTSPVTTNNGPPAPMNVSSSDSSKNNPTPLDASHGPALRKSAEVGPPTKIASSALPFSGPQVHPVGPVGPPAKPGTQQIGTKPETDHGRGDVSRGKANFGPYMAELQRRIKRNWEPPKDRTSRQVVVEFTLTRSGELRSVRLSRTSGLAKNDQAAIDAIRAAAPYAPLPEFADESVDIQFTFDYNVFGGHASF